MLDRIGTHDFDLDQQCLGPLCRRLPAAVARDCGDSPEPFSVTVALSTTRDVLTSIRHQDDLLVMRPGGYRFGDDRQLGLSLCFMVLACGTGQILNAWPLR